MATRTKLSVCIVVLLFTVTFRVLIVNAIDEWSNFAINEATIEEIQKAFNRNDLTSRQLVDFYLNRIQALNPVLAAVLEVNPDARDQADKADCERRENQNHSLLHGIPVFIKDSFATFDKLNTTAGSYALLGSKVPRDAHVVSKLRDAGAIILGKTSLSEWYGVRSSTEPEAWCARGGFAINPYVEFKSPCGSSFGSAISVATNMVVGIKPTVGLTSRAGVIPVSPRLDTIGPICRTVSDAVHVLDVIVGFDPRDYEATKSAAKFIPSGGYLQFLNKKGLKGKKIGVLRNPFLIPYKGSKVISIFENHLNVLRKRGATVVDNLEVENLSIVLDPLQSGEMITLIPEFKLSINKYLQELIHSPVKSLAEIIEFNINNPILEKTNEYGQDLFMASELTNGFGKSEIEAVKMMDQLSKNGFERLIKEYQLDAVLAVGSNASPMFAIGGYPAITVPAGYDNQGMPFGICFGGLKGTEPKLIEIAYDFEQATTARKPPPRFSFT
ncbi:unnamed protein product [Vicia faba]|uniref:Amidase domain-containing protein n=1 Tax=Vicia faba TaxID=3906 RepID=A0AAV1B2K7_VICFA|nr:unnamed protein product [Vicia faba]